ncbi:hypothetical protein C9J01_06345 [Photobacterium rosenbergii]|uniref:HTH araC/xylS-type domain-containing protein n=1 Tax=Photobacterium rosenbergii TaxID=294936 RepID=A0A2T3NM83_9GAMM|nr:helix-turn-helix transcriptional regulator [Photobacterium rosenbergii]PSW16611.1 hypothetical protein C9J01_06345 [Photobacterium rosenbergii]
MANKLNVELVIEEQWQVIREALSTAKVEYSVELTASMLDNFSSDLATPTSITSLFSFMDLIVPKLTKEQYHYISQISAQKNAANAIKYMDFPECHTVRDALESYCSQSTQIMTDTLLCIEPFLGEIWFKCHRSYIEKPRFKFIESYGLYFFRELVSQFSGTSWKPAKLALRSPNSDHIDTEMCLATPVILIGRDFYGLAVEKEVLQLPMQLRSYSSIESIFRHADINFAVALRYVMISHLGDGVITLDRLSKATQLSNRTIQRRLEEIGTNFHEFYGDIIINEAKRLLSNSANSVTDISYRLGYSSPPSFIRYFKNKVGVTPKQFQKQFLD